MQLFPKLHFQLTRVSLAKKKGGMLKMSGRWSKPYAAKKKGEKKEEETKNKPAFNFGVKAEPDKWHKVVEAFWLSRG